MDASFIIGEPWVLRTLQNNCVHDRSVATIVVEHAVNGDVSATGVEAERRNSMRVDVNELVILPVPALVM